MPDANVSTDYNPDRDAKLLRIAVRESKDQNVTQDSGGPASGYFQIEDSSRGGSGTWEQAAAWAGLPKRPDGTYGRAMDYTYDQQLQAARALYDRRGTTPWKASETRDQLGGGGSDAAMVNTALGNIDLWNQQKQALQAPIFQQMQEQYKQDRLRFDKVAEDYTPIQETRPPPQPQNDPLKGFASLGSVFAALASGFTHTPAINAMNGMAAAINATKKGDWDAYEAGYKQWKDQTEIAIQHHKLQAEDMRNAMEMMQTNLTAGVAMANAVAAQSNDKISMELLKLGQYEKFADLQLRRDQYADGMKKTAIEVEKMHDEVQRGRDLDKAIADMHEARDSGDPEKIAKANQNLQDQLMRNPTFAAYNMGLRGQSAAQDKEIELKQRAAAQALKEGVDPGPAGDQRRAQIIHDLRVADKAEEAGAAAKARIDASQVTYTPKEMDNFASQYISSGGHDKPPLPWGASANKAREQFADAVSKKLDDLNLTGGDLPGIGAELGAKRGALTNLIKQNAAINAFSDTAVQNGKVLIDLAKKVDTTGLPVAERWIRAGRKAIFGDPDVTEFDAQLRTYSNEVAKIISNPNLTGVLSDHARREVESFIPESANVAQIEALTRLFEGDFGRRLNANQAEIDDLTKAVRSPAAALKPKDSSPATKGAPAHPDVPAALQGKQGIQWSPSRQQWRDSDGKVYDQSGNEVH